MNPRVATLPDSHATGIDILEATRAHVRAVLERTRGDGAGRESQLRFQALIAELAAKFLGQEGADLSEALGHSLERIAAFSGAERAALIRVEMPGAILHVTHEWSADNQSDVLRSIQGRKTMAWTLSQLGRGLIVHVEDPNAFPAEADEERLVWKLFSVRSVLAIPVRTTGGNLLGFALFLTTSRKADWREEQLPLFDLAAGMLRSAFEQQSLRVELGRSELRLGKLLDSGTIGILSADKTGRIWEANAVALTAMGASLEDLTAGRLRWDNHTPAEYRPLTANALDQLERTGSSAPWEQDISRADGTRVSILVCVARLAEQPDRFLMYAVDNTAKKEAERELAMRNRLSRLLTLYSTRLIAVGPQEIVETIGEALRETSNVLGIDRCTMWVDVDGSSTVARCVFAWARNGPATDLSRIPPVDRSEFPIWNEDFRQRRAMRVGDVRTDLPPESTERRFLETFGLRAGVAVALFGSEVPMGFVTWGSAAVTEWPDSTIGILKLLGEIFSAAIARGRVEARRERVQNELESRIAKRTIELENANHELEAFSYAVSHDLRAPLRAVDGFSRILVEDHAEGLPSDARSVLDRICATTGRMGELIDALLHLSRITRAEPQMERIDLSSIAREQAAALAAAQPDRHVEFRIEDGVFAEGEPRLLTALMDNLLRNAWKFSSHKARARIEFGAEKIDSQRVFFVRDNGAGFDPSQAERIFMPFQRLHDPAQFEGHGVGLATVKRIVSVHEGRVWAEGELENGATIRFTLSANNPLA